LLSGTVDYAMYRSFRDQLSGAPAEGLVVVELSTLGGDPEVARTMERISVSIAICRASGASSFWERPDLHGSQ